MADVSRAQWPPTSPRLLLLLLLCVYICSAPIALGHTASCSSSFPPATAPCPTNACPAANARVTTAVVVGATGNLAAKYLWVALFRLALRASVVHGESFAFVAGASDLHELGSQWLRSFFDAAFERRVCGSIGSGDTSTTSGNEQAHACATFYRDTFVPSVRYMPLRSETHYREAAQALNDRETAAVEAGRLVYLAIPPSSFLQTCELVNRFLRIPRDASVDMSASFLRVIIEKPFGTSLTSAQALATGLKGLLQDDEIFLMDHYAGKPGVRAWRSYLARNRELLRPLWSSRYVRHVQIEMTETETLEERVQYFHSTGIVRDVMVNHLNLLLGFTIAPSAVPNESSRPNKLTDKDREQRLAFTKSLRWSNDSLYSWQYADYREHFDREATREAPMSAPKAFRTPTAARVTFTSDLAVWNATLFTLAAAKAASERLLTIQITFESADRDSELLSSPCTLTAVIQRAVNARDSQRIEWSCDLIPSEAHSPPSGWQFTDMSKRSMTPVSDTESMSRGHQPSVWQLGDEVTAYDSLLWDAATRDKSHFADVDEVLAAWQLWTSVAETAEEVWPSSEVEHHAEEMSRGLYPSGTTPWRLDRPATSPSDAKTTKPSYFHVAEEL